MKNSLLISVLGALGALLLGACSSTHFVHLRHPLQVGSVDPNSIPFEASHAARTRGLPAGSLVDDVSLTVVTPEQVCVHMTLWSLESNPERTIVQNYDMSLLSDRDGVQVSTPQVQLEQPTMTPMQGHVARRIPAGTRRVCSGRRQGRCVSWRNQTIYRTIYEPHIYQVTNQPATVCFPNQGFITPATTRIALELDYTGSAGRHVYEWQLDSAVQGGPPPAQAQQ